MHTKQTPTTNTAQDAGQIDKADQWLSDFTPPYSASVLAEWGRLRSLQPAQPASAPRDTSDQAEARKAFAAAGRPYYRDAAELAASAPQAHTPYLAQPKKAHRDNFVREIRETARNWDLPEHAIEALACVASDTFFAAFAQSKEDGHFCLESTAGLAHAAGPELLHALQYADERLQFSPLSQHGKLAFDAIAHATQPAR